MASLFRWAVADRRRGPMIILHHRAAVPEGNRTPVADACTLSPDSRVRNTRVRRGIASDGESRRPLWNRWLVDEGRFFTADDTRPRADVIVDGTAPSR